MRISVPVQRFSFLFAFASNPFFDFVLDGLEWEEEEARLDCECFGDEIVVFVLGLFT